LVELGRVHGVLVLNQAGVRIEEDSVVEAGFVADVDVGFEAGAEFPHVVAFLQQLLEVLLRCPVDRTSNALWSKRKAFD
jgi:hypothetical protein